MAKRTRRTQPAREPARAAVAISRTRVELGRVFDARPDRLDFRDLPYRAPLRSLPRQYPEDGDVRRFISSYVEEGLVLDQGTEGACTGFGLACVANYLLWRQHLQTGAAIPFLPVSPRMLYELARRYDEWPGTDYEGSSCRGALKGWHKHGVCSAKMWPYELDRAAKPTFVRPRPGWEVDASSRPLGVYYRVDRDSVVDLQSAIVNIGAVYVSGSAHDGWDSLTTAKATRAPATHRALPSIPPTRNPKSLGGHAFALVGYNDRGFVIQNSWGRRWGASGFAVLPYDDWVVHGTDAWACALGVPVALPDASGGTRAIVATRWPVPSGQSLNDLDRNTRTPANPADDPWPFDHPFLYAGYEPWSTPAAYEHTLVTGNDGELVMTDLTRDPADRTGLVEDIVRTKPMAWFRQQSASVLKVAIYAHGGLNAQDESIKRIRVLGPCFQANDVYPIFLTWKTGVGETLADMTEDWLRKLFGPQAERVAGILEALGDAKDRSIEAIAHVFGKGVWSEMRENAARSAEPSHGLDLLYRNLAQLADDVAQSGKSLQVHLVGHSAGSIPLGHLVDRMRGARVAAAPTIATTTLFAAACSTHFAVDTYLAAAAARIVALDKLWLCVLSDANEKEDGLPTPDAPAYGKSLLYLVSRALDDKRKMPLLGMDRALDSKYSNDSDQWAESELDSVRKWQQAWPPSNVAPEALRRVITEPTVRCTRAGDRVQATHGSFDNNLAVMSETIERIRGAKLVADLEWLDY